MSGLGEKAGNKGEQLEDEVVWKVFFEALPFRSKSRDKALDGRAT